MSISSINDSHTVHLESLDRPGELRFGEFYHNSDISIPLFGCQYKGLSPQPMTHPPESFAKMTSIAEKFFNQMGFPKFSLAFDSDDTQNLSHAFGGLYNVFKELEPSCNEDQFAAFFKIVGETFAESDEVKDFLASTRDISVIVCSNSFAMMPRKSFKTHIKIPENRRFFAFRAGNFVRYVTVWKKHVLISQTLELTPDKDIKVKFAGSIWLFSESDHGVHTACKSSLSQIVKEKLYKKVVNFLEFIDPPTTALSPEPMTHLPEDGIKMIQIAEKFFNQIGFPNFNSVFHLQELQKISPAFGQIYNVFKEKNPPIDEKQFAAFLRIVGGAFSQSDEVKSFLASSQDTCVIVCSNSYVNCHSEWFEGVPRKPEDVRLFALRAGNFAQYAAFYEDSAMLSKIVEVPSDEDTRMRSAVTIWFFSESDHGALMARKSNLDNPIKVELYKKVVYLADFTDLLETSV